MKDLYELKEMAIEELKEYGRRGEINPRDLPCIDTLAHTAKNLCKIIEMAEERTGYSYGARGSMRGTYRYGADRSGSYGARGGNYSGMMPYYGNNGYNGYGRRDSRGRYAGDDEWMVETLNSLIQNAPNDHMKMELEEFRERVEQMK